MNGTSNESYTFDLVEKRTASHQNVNYRSFDRMTLTVALEALKTIEYHQIILKSDAGCIFSWNGRILVPLYHPSPQVIASRRRMYEQLEVFKSVAEALRANVHNQGGKSGFHEI